MYITLGVSRVLFRPIVYFKVTPGKLEAQVMGTTTYTAVVSKGLSHPRSLMGDFSAVETCMKEAIIKLGLKGWLKRAPVILTHLIPEVEGCYTNVELRAFREAAFGAGAAQSWLLANHPPLSPHDVSEIKKHFGKSLL